MLAVDPVKRITVPEIIQHPFFHVDLPRYLKPLPPPPGPVLGTLSALVTPGKAIDFEIIDGLGRIEEDVVEELALRMEGIDKEDVWECLRREDGVQGNAVKVAYMLLRDKRRLGRDRKFLPFCYIVLVFICIPVAAYEEQERDARLAALDVRPLLVSQTSSYTSYSHGTYCHLLPCHPVVLTRRTLSKVNSIALMTKKTMNSTSLLPHLMSGNRSTTTLQSSTRPCRSSFPNSTTLRHMQMLNVLGQLSRRKSSTAQNGTLVFAAEARQWRLCWRSIVH
jgi:hypothetical protein